MRSVIFLRYFSTNMYLRSKVRDKAFVKFLIILLFAFGIKSSLVGFLFERGNDKIINLHISLSLQEVYCLLAED